MCSNKHSSLFSPRVSHDLHLGIEDLSKDIAQKKIGCFLCGAGVGTEGYSTRESLRNFLTNECKVDVVFGEDLPERIKFPRSQRKLDLQTMESEYAKSVDLTILMLDSPGAIAELGSFCMIPRIRCHLYVLIPDRFHRTESYIARGPLDLLARMHSLSVIYYPIESEIMLPKLIAYPIMLHKYARKQFHYKYIQALTKGKYLNSSLEKTMVTIRNSFLPSYIAASISILDEPLFADLVNALHILPEELRRHLKKLFKLKAIIKVHGRYTLINSFESDIFSPFNVGSLSKKRCIRLAMI